MKTLAIIWAIVFVTGTAGAVVINHSINNDVNKPATFYQLQPADQPSPFDSACLQNCKPVNLQPAKSIQ